MDELEENDIVLQADDNLQEYLDENINDEDLTFDITKSSDGILKYGRDLSNNDWIRQRERNNEISVNHYDSFSALIEPYKFMSAKVYESNEALNNYLDDFVYEITVRCKELSETNIEDESFRNLVTELADESSLMTRFTMKTAVENYYIGRIRFGYSAQRLSSKRILLEADTTYCHGDVVPLDLSLLFGNDVSKEHSADRPSVSLFPGQVVIVKARNATGSLMQVTNFIEWSHFFAPNFSPEFPSVLSLQHESVNLVCASGPFIPIEANNEVDFADVTHMKALANYLKRYNSDVLFLFGPIYDKAHSDQMAKWSLKQSLNSDSSTASCQWTMERLFFYQIRALCKELECQSVNTRVVFVPSPSELSGSNIYPTYPSEMKQVLPIHCVANPSILCLGGITVGVNSADILLHMSRHEISNISAKVDSTIAGKHTDRLKRLCAHILNHKSFYPLLPPDRDVNMEYAKYSHLSMPITPHLLVLPSILRPFVYNVHDSIVINPGKLYKNTIARIMIDPMHATNYTGSLSEHINVEIIKLLD